MRVLDDWSGKYKFLHPDYKHPVKVRSRVFKSVSHALAFNRVAATYATDDFYEEVQGTKARNLVKFSSYPESATWYTNGMRDVLWTATISKFKKELRRKLLDIRNTEFHFTEGWGGNIIISQYGSYIDPSKGIGDNLIGRSLNSVRSYFLSEVFVVVCGGRHYEDRVFLSKVMFYLASIYPIREIIQGGASGADTLAYYWALDTKVRNVTIRADWDNIQGLEDYQIKYTYSGKPYNPKAGHERNVKMADYLIEKRGIKDCQILILAFDGGVGTQDMIRTGLRKGIPVLMQRGNKMETVVDLKLNTKVFTPSSLNKLDGTTWL